MHKLRQMLQCNKRPRWKIKKKLKTVIVIRFYDMEFDVALNMKLYKFYYMHLMIAVLLDG